MFSGLSFRRRIKRVSYRSKMLSAFLILTIAPILIIGIFSYWKSTSILEEQIKNSISESAQQINIIISKRLNQVQEVSDLILSSKDIQEMIYRSDVSSYYNQVQSYHSMSDYLGNLENNFNLLRIRFYIHPNPIYVNEGYNIFPLNILAKQIPGFKLDERNEGRINWLPTYNFNYDRFSETNTTIPIISAFHTFRSLSAENNLNGIYFIDIPELDLNKSFDAVGLPYINNVLTIVSDKGMVISSKDKTIIGKEYAEEFLDNVLSASEGSIISDDKLVTFKTIAPVGWKVIISVPMEGIRSKINVIGNFTAIIGFLTIITAIFVSIFISRSLTKRIRFLSVAMKSRKMEDKAKILINVRTNTSVMSDEIDDLIHTYNKMTDRINTLVYEVYRAKIEETEAQLKALQSQINPHFLYNILGAIQMQLEGLGDDKASGMIASLARFFQISLSNGVDKITISDELELIQHYLELQNLIYPDNFTWEIEIDKNIESFIITKFTLQPIVENAIHHGVRQIKARGMISIKGYFAGDSIIIKVIDSGVGMTPDVLEKVRNSLVSKGQIDGHGKGYGLRNVNARLKLQWGNQYGLQIDSSENKGTTVTVTIPQEV